MSDEKTVCLWMGQDIETLSREELLEAVKTLGKMYEASLTNHRRELNFTLGLINGKPNQTNPTQAKGAAAPAAQ